MVARLINREVARGAIKGIKLGPGAVAISKLFYVDDLILFSGAKIRKVATLMT